MYITHVGMTDNIIWSCHGTFHSNINHNHETDYFCSSWMLIILHIIRLISVVVMDIRCENMDMNKTAYLTKYVYNIFYNLALIVHSILYNNTNLLLVISDCM